MDLGWKDTSRSFEERTRILISQMTLEEKVSQMTFFSSALSRFGIPEYNWWNECLHGVARAGTATVFPQAIGMAASFDEALLGRVASVISDEARIKHYAAADLGDRGIYKGLTMWSPNVNLFRDPRWGRGHETYGEDPYLSGRMGVRFVRGLQGDHPKYLKCVATAKHFAVHSGPEASRHSFDARVSKKELNETYLPAFRAAVVEGGAFGVMGAYNRVNGEAACASPTLLGETLRDEWGFQGAVVSDCGAIEDIFHHHHLAGDMAEAAAMAVKAGCDLCCGQAFPALMEAVTRGLIAEAEIDRSVYRLIYTRMRLGLFDPREGQPCAEMDYLQNDCTEHHALSLQMADESLVLLKNDGLLPLNPAELHTIAVIGPNADSREALLGNYAGTPSETYTVYEGIRALAGDARVLYAEGSALTGGSPESGWGESDSFRLAEAIRAAQEADAIVMVVGLNGIVESEEGSGTGDRASLALPRPQLDLIEAVAAVGKPMVLVNMTGSATTFPDHPAVAAILQAWYPGQMGGLAVASTLFGMVSPSGRLPVTFYRGTDQLPPFEDYSMAGRTYRYMEQTPAYPFGFGLSYARFAYRELNARREGEGAIVRVTVRNESTIAGREVAQVYASFVNPAFGAPIRRLVAFTTVWLEPGEEARLVLPIGAHELCLYNDAGEIVPHAGPIRLYVSGGQPDTRTRELTGACPLEATI